MYRSMVIYDKFDDNVSSFLSKENLPVGWGKEAWEFSGHFALEEGLEFFYSQCNKDLKQ